jgi:hypothetical protein
MENTHKYDFMKYRHRLLYYRITPIYIRYTLYMYDKFVRSVDLPLKIRVKSSFSHPVLGRSRCRLSNSTAIFLPNVSDVWKWQNPVKIPNVPFFITKSAMEPKMFSYIQDENI